MKVFEWIPYLLDRLCIVLGAFAGSQIPAFMQQYLQRLGGRVDELHSLLNQLKTAAAHSNKTLEGYIQKFLLSSDPDFVHQGEFMRQIETRLQQLDSALSQLAHSSLWERPFIFIKDLQMDIARSTMVSFHPSLNLTLEGLCYIGAGMLAGCALYHAASKCIQSIIQVVHQRFSGLGRSDTC